jgi:hypothetical protein
LSVRLLLVADEARHREEASALRRFAVGLAAEGHRPALLLGVRRRELDGHPPRLGPIPMAEVPVEVPWWIRARAAEAVLAPLAASRLDRPEVVVAMGRGAIAMSSSIARLVGATLIVDVRCKADLDGVGSDVGLVVAATSALRDLAARRVGSDRAVELPIPAPRRPGSIRRAPGLAIALGPVGDLASWSAMIDGLGGPGGVVPGLSQLALELSDRHRDAIVWKRLRRSPLSDRMTSFDRGDRLRAPLATADVILVPDSGGPVRSLERQAVGEGGIVVAVADPLRSDRRPDLESRILDRGEARRPGAWREAVESAFAEAPSEASIHAAEGSLVSRVAPRWAALLETVVRGDATPIETARTDRDS